MSCKSTDTIISQANYSVFGTVSKTNNTIAYNATFLLEREDGVKR